MYRKRGDRRSFVDTRLAPREIFSHRVLAVAKPYPDSQLLLQRRGMTRATLRGGRFLQLNLYTTDFHDLPEALFTDPEINWHHQQFGQKGLVAAAGLWVRDRAATITTLQSDLCQQLFRSPQLRAPCRTRIETHFRYWYVILFNAILDFCLEREIGVVYCPTGRQVLATTEKAIAPDLFLRIYDHVERSYSCGRVMRDGCEYWEIPVAANAHRVTRLIDDSAPTIGRAPRPQICIFHDIEENIDTAVSAEECARDLDRMLEIERRAGVATTYDIVGALFGQKRDIIRAANPRHSLAFHSFNHDIRNGSQLPQCRHVDLQVRGYRPPQSRITAELADENLTFFNFEWLASSADSLGHADCRLENGVVKIPIHLDDYPLFTGAIDYQRWQADVLGRAAAGPLFGIGLHDCYARHWLPHYPSLLDRLGRIGTLVTADDICDAELLRHGDAAPALPQHRGGARSVLARAAHWLGVQVGAA